MGKYDRNFYDWASKALTVAAMLAWLSACSSSGTEDTLEGDEISADSEELSDAGTDAVPEDSLEEPEASAQASTEELVEPEKPAEFSQEPVIPETTEQDQALSEPPVVPAPEAPVAPEPMPADDMAMAQPSTVEAAPESFSGSGQYESHTIQRGDTLMRVAFEYYGDLYQWKKIYEANRDKISDPNVIPVGTVLKVERPQSSVSVERNGERYMIKQGDTLGSISQDLYGTRSKWKQIYENNRKLIRDPNRIYAGFNLYYNPEGRQTAPQLADQQSTMPMDQVPAVVEDNADMRAPSSEAMPAGQ